MNNTEPSGLADVESPSGNCVRNGDGTTICYSMNHSGGVDVVTCDANGNLISGYLSEAIAVSEPSASVSEFLGSDASYLPSQDTSGVSRIGAGGAGGAAAASISPRSALSVGKSPGTGNGSPGLLPQGGGGWLGPSVDVQPDFLLPATGGSGQFSRVNGIYGGGENGVNMGSWITYGGVFSLPSDTIPKSNGETVVGFGAGAGGGFYIYKPKK